MVEALALGLSLGLGAGLAPGPLLALVIRSTLQDGGAAGIRVALSPLADRRPHHRPRLGPGVVPARQRPGGARRRRRELRDLARRRSPPRVARAGRGSHRRRVSTTRPPSRRADECAQPAPLGVLDQRRRADTRGPGRGRLRAVPRRVLSPAHRQQGRPSPPRFMRAATASSRAAATRSCCARRPSCSSPPASCWRSKASSGSAERHSGRR